MKKIMATMLAASLLAACGNASSSSESSSESVSSSANTSSSLNVSVFYSNYADVNTSNFRIALDKMLSHYGVNFQNYDAASNQSTQTDGIKTALS